MHVRNLVERKNDEKMRMNEMKQMIMKSEQEALRVVIALKWGLREDDVDDA